MANLSLHTRAKNPRPSQAAAHIDGGITKSLAHSHTNTERRAAHRTVVSPPGTFISPLDLIFVARSPRASSLLIRNSLKVAGEVELSGEKSQLVFSTVIVFNKRELHFCAYIAISI